MYGRNLKNAFIKFARIYRHLALPLNGKRPFYEMNSVFNSRVFISINPRI